LLIILAWHILGLMHRQDKNYEEAIKCYKNALRIDKNNFQILRDLALLQLQCRQLEGAIDTRRKIVFARSSSPFNWISLVIIYHLSGNLKHALELMNIYLELFGSIKDAAENHRFYKVSLMMELGIYKEAINYLQTSLVKQNTRRFYETLGKLKYCIYIYNVFS
jgi:N-alpha-acetyltransferase 15/16, NatA auxiliary subunit